MYSCHDGLRLASKLKACALASVPSAGLVVTMLRNMSFGLRALGLCATLIEFLILKMASVLERRHAGRHVGLGTDVKLDFRIVRAL